MWDFLCESFKSRSTKILFFNRIIRNAKKRKNLTFLALRNISYREKLLSTFTGICMEEFIKIIIRTVKARPRMIRVQTDHFFYLWHLREVN